MNRIVTERGDLRMEVSYDWARLWDDEEAMIAFDEDELRWLLTCAIPTALDVLRRRGEVPASRGGNGVPTAPPAPPPAAAGQQKLLDEG
jgi:hypothetical protein